MRNLYNIARKKTDDFDIYQQNIESEIVSFENDKIKSIERKVEQGYGVRVVKNNKIGFSSSNDFLKVEETVDNGIEISSFGEKASFKFPKARFDFEDLSLNSPDIRKINSMEMIRVGDTLKNRLKELDNGLKVNVYLEKGNITNRLVNSGGLDFTESKDIFQISATIFKAEENNFLEIWDGAYLIGGDTPENVTGEIFNRIKFLYDSVKKPVKIDSSAYPVFFTSKAFSTILNMILKSFDGKLIEKKISFFTDKFGQKLYNIPITIEDNPLKKFYPLSRNFDGDGVKAAPIKLIEKGRVNNFFLDIQTAGNMGKESNGHSLRSYKSLPSPGNTNIFFTIEDDRFRKKEEDIIKSIDKGIIIDQFLGAGQSNILAGEFSMNIDLGYFVEDGEIKGRIKDCMVAGNLFELFGNIKAIGDKSLYYNGIETPSVLIESLPIKA